MNLKDYFDKGISNDQYVPLLGDNTALHHRHYEKFQIPNPTSEKIKQMKPLNILVITEPWCGDSLALFPVIRKIAEHGTDWGFKISLRDQNLDLMDQFLTNGGRAVPIFLFLDHDFSLIFKWGPRPNAAQNIFEQHRQAVKDGTIEKTEVYKKIRNFYAKDKGNAIMTELLDIFTQMGLC